jgi:hypothetical protein
VEEAHPQEYMLMVFSETEPRAAVAATKRWRRQGTLW